MRLVRFVTAFLGLVALAAPAWAIPAKEVNAVPHCLVANLNTCAGGLDQGRTAWVLDGLTDYDCDTGGGTFQHACVRTEDGWRDAATAYRISPSYNVMAYGAAADAQEATCSTVFACTADGSGTNDSDAFQDAFDAACAAGGGRVVAPPGEYRIAGVIVSCDDAWLDCLPGAVLLPTGASGGTMISWCQGGICGGASAINRPRMTGCYFKDDDPEGHGRPYYLGQADTYENGDAVGTPTAYADYSDTIPETIKATLVDHGLKYGGMIYLTGDTNGYDGLHNTVKIDNDNFYFSGTFTTNDAPRGTFYAIPMTGNKWDSDGAGWPEGYAVWFDAVTKFVRFYVTTGTFADEDSMQRNVGPGGDYWLLDNVDIDGCTNCGAPTSSLSFGAVYVESGRDIDFRGNTFENFAEFSTKLYSTGSVRGRRAYLNNVLLNCPSIPSMYDSSNSCVIFEDFDYATLTGTIEGGAGHLGRMYSANYTSNNFNEGVWIHDSTEIDMSSLNLEDDGEFPQDRIYPGIRLSANALALTGIRMRGGRLVTPPQAVYNDQSNYGLPGYVLTNVNPVSGVIGLSGDVDETTITIDGIDLTCGDHDAGSAITGYFSEMTVTRSNIHMCPQSAFGIWCGDGLNDNKCGPMTLSHLRLYDIGYNTTGTKWIINFKGAWAFDESVKAKVSISDVSIKQLPDGDQQTGGVNCGGYQYVDVERVTVEDSDWDAFNGCPFVKDSTCIDPTNDCFTTWADVPNAHLSGNQAIRPGDDGFEINSGFAEVENNLIVNPGDEPIEDNGYETRCLNNRSQGNLTIFTVATDDIENGTPLVGDDVELVGGGAPNGYIAAISTGLETDVTYIWFNPDSVAADVISPGQKLQEQGGGDWNFKAAGSGVATVEQAATAVTAITCGATGSTESGSIEDEPAP